MPKALDVRTASIVVQDAVVRALELAYLRRYQEVADLAALAAVTTEPLPNRALIWVLSEGVVYQLSKASTDTPLSPDIIEATAMADGCGSHRA